MQRPFTSLFISDIFMISQTNKYFIYPPISSCIAKVWKLNSIYLRRHANTAQWFCIKYKLRECMRRFTHSCIFIKLNEIFIFYLTICGEYGKNRELLHDHMYSNSNVSQLTWALWCGVHFSSLKIASWAQAGQVDCWFQG